LIQPGVYREAIALKNPGARDDHRARPGGGLEHDGLVLGAGVLQRDRLTVDPGLDQYCVAGGPGTVVITGAEGLTGWQKEGGEKPIYSVSWAYDFFRNKEKPGIEARMHGGRQDDPATKLAELVIWNSRPLRQVLAYDQLQPGNFHVDREKDRLAVWPPGGLDPSANRVEAAARSALFAPHDWRQQKNKRDFTTVPYITIKGLTFRYAANFPQEGMVITGKGWRLEDCVVEWCNGVGLQVHGDDVVLLGCIGQDNGQMGIGGSSGKNILVKDCTVRRNNWKGFNVSWEQDRRINQRRRRSEYARR
jgi:hypothetical protein